MKKMFRLMAMAIVVMAFAACGSKSATPENAADAFLKDYQKGKYAALVEQMHFSDAVTREQKDQFAQLIEAKVGPEVEKKGGIAAYEIVETVVAEDGQSAKVKYNIIYGDESKDENEQLNLVLVDGKWMIDGGK